MRSRRRSPAILLVHGLLALSMSIRRGSVSAFCDGRLGAVSTHRLLAFADAVTARAAGIALAARIGSSPARASAGARRDRTDDVGPSRPYRSALLVTIRTVPVGLLAATLWPGVRCMAVLAVALGAGLSSAVRRQGPTTDRLTDWDVAVALCFAAVVSDRLLS